MILKYSSSEHPKKRIGIKSGDEYAGYNESGRSTTAIPDRSSTECTAQSAGPKIGLGMFGNLPHVVVHFTEQLCDKILNSHPIPPGWIPHQYLAGTG